MKINHISLWCIATALCLLPQSCDKNDPSIALPGTSVSSAGMNLQVTTNSIIPVRSDAGTLTRVFGDPEDGITMTEYVSDIVDIMPETKGTVVTGFASGAQFQVNAYRAFSQSEMSETGDKYKDDNDDDVYNNGTKSKTTKTVRDFSMLSTYNGSGWSWPAGKQPHWRNKSVFSIWSMFPANSTALSPSTLNPAMPQPDWTNTALDAIADVDPAGKTDAEIAAAEKARQEAIQAYLRSMTFDYELPLYAPTTASTSIYKDLLFAYNEEMREFEVEDGKLKEDPNGNNIIKNGKSESFNVKFYHALSAVKFELVTDFDGDGKQDKTSSGNNDFHGADIHSVTLCYTDGGNIVTTNGIATKGTCTASPKDGSDGSREVDFSWPKTSLTNRKPMHFVFNDGTSSTTKVSGGYASTGDGVLFMIPQTATGLKVIVEFSKYGGTEYFTKVITKGLDIEWIAGKCYTYTFKIGEFHVPGEKFPELTNVTIVPLKNNSGTTFTRPDNPIKTKGVTKIGLAINGYGCASKEGQEVYMYCNAKGSSNTRPGAGSGFYSNFEPVEKINDNLFEIDTDNTQDTDKYFDCYTFGRNQEKSKSPSSNGVKDYFVFDTYDSLTHKYTDTFQIFFLPSAGDASGGFMIDLIGLFVLEVETDPNLPGNFNTINWEALLSTN